MEAYILQPSDDTAKRLQLSNTICNLDTRCQSLQCENDRLRRTFVISLQGVRFTRTKLVTSTTIDNLNGAHFHDICRSTDDKVDRLEFFSRRNNVSFFCFFLMFTRNVTKPMRTV